MKKFLIILLILLSLTTFGQRDDMNNIKQHLVIISLPFSIPYYNDEKVDITVTQDIIIDTASVIQIVLIDCFKKTLYYQALSFYDNGNYQLRINIYHLKNGKRFSELEFLLKE